MVQRPVIDLHPAVLALCQGFSERASAAGLRGTRRDLAALDYFIGGWCALQSQAGGGGEAARCVADFATKGLAHEGFRLIQRAIEHDARMRADRTAAIIEGFSLDPNMGGLA
jgi:hypothetical protein